VRADVGHHEVLHGLVAGRPRALHGRAERDHAVRVEGAVRDAPELLRGEGLCARHPRGAADEEDVVDVGPRQPGVREAAAHDRREARGERARRLLERRAGELDAATVEVHLDAVGGGEGGFGDLDALAPAPGGPRRRLEPRQRHGLGEQRVRVVLAAEATVAARRADLDDPLEDLQDRHVERAAAEVEHDEAALLLRVALSVRKRRGVGSLRMRSTWRPASRAASIVAWRCGS
jgi:hypothetical protein